MEPILSAIRTDSVLLCHEKDPSECHRSILAKILREQFGVEIEEWSPEE